MPRGAVAGVLDSSNHTARRVISALTTRGIVLSATPKGALRIEFPAQLAAQWMPGLFPDR